MKSEAKLNNKITTEVYSYLPNGKPAGIDITSGNMQFHTSFFYDAQDRCAQEIQINTENQKRDIQKRADIQCRRDGAKRFIEIHRW